MLRGMKTRLLYNTGAVTAASRERYASSPVTTALSQTESKQLTVSVVLWCDQWVWSRVPRVGPAVSLILLRFLTAPAGRPSELLFFLSSRVSPERPQKYLISTHQACFSKAALTLVRTTTPPLPSHRCSVSRGQPVTGRHSSKLPNVKTVLTNLAWRFFFFFLFSRTAV